MPHKFISTFILTFLTILILFFTLIFAVLFSVSSSTATSLFYFPSLLSDSHFHPSLSPPLNFLILGLDPRDDSLEKTETTDTIIFANLTDKFNINLISLPRDLWDYPLNTKINQIYPLSIGQTAQFDYIQSHFSELLNQKIDRTLVVTTQNLIDLVDLVGGVDVYLDQGFKDEEYPNPAYIANPSAQIPIYITVEFPDGLNHLDSTNIAPFVRSRKSAQTAAQGGTDIGRIQRQQLLLDALLSKFKSPQFYQNPQNLLRLYRFFHTDLETNLTDRDLASLALQGYPYFSQLSIHKIEISTGENPKTDLLYHPSVFINKQWVFIPQDKNYSRFQKFISESLQNSL